MPLTALARTCRTRGTKLAASMREQLRFLSSRTLSKVTSIEALPLGALPSFRGVMDQDRWRTRCLVAGRKLWIFLNGA